MSESMSVTVPEPVPQNGLLLAVSAGALLREAREAQGLHIGALAVALKIPVKKLEALEADQFDLLPGMVFIRALTASICRTLKIDPAPILEKLPATTLAHLKTDDAGINTPFRMPCDASWALPLKQLSRPLVLAVVLLLLGAAVLVVYPLFQRPVAASAPKSELSTVIIAPTSPAPKAKQDPVAVLVPAANPVPAESVPGLSASESLVVVPGTGATTGLLVVKAHGVSWLRVVDASGVIQVSKNMSEGEVVGVSGVLPLSVVVGRSDTTEVQVRGKSFDLTGIAKSNVARFEVK
jgi:cytoskeleton protein RodZ